MATIDRAVKKLLRLPAVIERTGISASTIRRLRRANQFPQPIRTSVGTIAWLESDIEAWITRVAKRRD
jgi:prophage regulatory protein